MEKNECELCGSELHKNINLCSYCNWPCPSPVKESPEVIKRQQEMLEVAQKYLEGWRSTYKKYLEIYQENSEIKKDLKEIYFKFKNIDEKVRFSHHDSIDEFNQEADEQPTAACFSTELESEVGKSDNNSLLSPEVENLKNDKEVTDLVQKYNQQFEFPYKIEVSETENSKSQRRTGSKSSPVFERIKRGQYWVINNSYLVPKRNEKINEHSYKTVSIFFECINYDKRSTDNFTLMKPAKITSLNTEDEWQFEERGIIEFL